MKRPILTIICGASLLALGSPALRSEEAPSFNRDVRPILAAKCFACHGPDENHREADLRLDEREAALDAGAFEPGAPDDSELVQRILSEDDDDRMPPPDAGETLTDAEKTILRAWIASGAVYETHWAFVPPQFPKLPPVKAKGWPRNEIDRFVLARLERQGLLPAKAADKYTLVRRLYLDLIGLPPTPEQADAFVNSKDPAAYKTLVDQLLESPHYGERWARQWLDLARYSDTNGYEKDRPRSIWPYRDWVIQALNDDMPFDQFTIEQLAGDMLPNATQSQRVATGFHRNTMLNEEGGIDPLEYRFYAMVDRVATTSTVWLGLTMGCAQCHTHKYDPITHTDYYRFMALLNNADEPDLRVDDAAKLARRTKIEQQIAKLEQDLPNKFPPGAGNESEETRRKANFERSFQQWLTAARKTAVPWTTLRPTELESNLSKLETLEDGSIFSSGDITKRDVFQLRFAVTQEMTPLTAIRLEVLPDERLPAGGPGRAFYEGRKGDFFLSELTAKHQGQPVKFADASHSFGKISIGSGNANAANVLDGRGSTGWSTSGHEGRANQLVLNLATPMEDAGDLQIEMLFERHFAASLGRFRISATSAKQPVQAKSLPVEIEQLLEQPHGELARDELASLQRYFASIAPELAKAREPIAKLRKQLPSPTMTMVMLERPADNPRPTHRHHRGEFLSPREPVTPGVPAMLPQLQENVAANRLKLAQWLVSDKNPLVGRVTVNRAWQAFFGAGLVRSNGDFGTQSQPPTHPLLLDYLACRFVEDGWSLKKLHRLIVTSATYRQTSAVPQDQYAADPGNRLLARGPRHRLDAEVIRDLSLVASGLFSPKMFGPSVYPPQPASVTALAYGATAWRPSAGPDRYRRSLYTFSKRTAPFAAYTVFDGPTGETCTARRDRSNTPLQSLTMLNDEMFQEFAVAAAKGVLDAERKERNPSQMKRHIASALFRRFLTRPVQEAELKVILDFYRQQHERIEKDELDARKLLKLKEGAKVTSQDIDRAAWTLVSRVLMNLDETITKQ